MAEDSSHYWIMNGKICCTDDPEVKQQYEKKGFVVSNSLREALDVRKAEIFGFDISRIFEQINGMEEQISRRWKDIMFLADQHHAVKILEMIKNGDLPKPAQDEFGTRKIPFN